MNRHQTSGNWRLGLLLAVLTMLLWATLPVALKLALSALDAWSLTWFRFLIAAVISLLWLAYRGGLSVFMKLRRSLWALLLVAAVMLTANYILYLLGLERTTPASAQVFIQLAPMLMALGSLAWFGERYGLVQWVGFVTLVAGLALFFSNQLGAMAGQVDHYLLGGWLVIGAAVGWAVYALIQKQLLRDMGSQAVMLFIYAFATLVLLPTAVPDAILALDGWQWLIVGYCALNTLGAYGCFAEALNHWEASRVSTVLALTPLGTVAVAMLVHAWWPRLIEAERLSLVSWAGALMVVGGSMITSLSGRRRTPAVN